MPSVSLTAYMASKGTVNEKYWIGGVKWSYYGLSWGIILLYAWKDWQKSFVKIVVLVWECILTSFKPASFLTTIHMVELGQNKS